MTLNDFVNSKTILVAMAITIFIRYIRSESYHKIILKQ